MKENLDCISVLAPKTEIGINQCLRAAVDSILSLTYGITPTNFEHPFIKIPEEISAIFVDVSRGDFLGGFYLFPAVGDTDESCIVDAFSFLRFLPKWFPGVKFHKIADKGRLLARDVVVGPYKEIQSQVV